jgi:two-component system, NtrC family, response regulator AtoC
MMDPGATTRLAPIATGAVGGAANNDDPRLVLVGAAGVDVIVVGEQDDLVVGSSAPADVVVDDAGVSRRHLRLRNRRGTLEVTDLGSTNGTLHGSGGLRAAQRTLLPPHVPVAVAAGDALTLGALRVFVVGGTQGGAPRGLLPHERFAGLLAEELARAALFRRPASLALVKVGDGDLAAASAALGRTLRVVDRAGVYASDIVEVLWPEHGLDDARRAAQALLPCLPAGSSAVVATYPTHATSAQALLAAATRALATPGVTTGATAGMTAGTTGKSVVVAGAIDDGDVDDGGIVAEAPTTQALFQTVTRVARSQIAVLLHGETGTGKEVVARALHARGPRQGRAFVAVNCGAIPANLIESTLFGHEKGAFTGADARAKGAFEQADGGTLFLDEVAELPAAAQAALLRVLETRAVRRVGGNVDVAVDVRVVAASHQDLAVLVARGAFRQDLLFRLNAFVIELPPLRERRADIAPLARRFVGAIARRDGRALRLADDATDALTRGSWPGNVRELKNALERAALLCDGDVVELDHLPSSLPAPRATAPVTMQSATPMSPVAATGGLVEGDDPSLSLPERLDRIEAALLAQTMRACDGDTAKAAERLGVPRRTLQHRLRTLGVR